MNALDRENLACEQHLILNDPDCRFDALARPPAPVARSSAPRRFDDRLWSRPRYSIDTIGRELACVTHADGHSIVWLSLDPSVAFLIGPDGSYIHTGGADAEARRYAEYWGAP